MKTEKQPTWPPTKIAPTPRRQTGFRVQSKLRADYSSRIVNGPEEGWGDPFGNRLKTTYPGRARLHALIAQRYVS